MSPDGRIIVTTWPYGLVDVETGAVLRRLPKVEGADILEKDSGTMPSKLYHASAAFSPDSTLLAVTDRAYVDYGDSGERRLQLVQLWYVQTGTPLQIFTRQTAQVWSLAFSPDGKIVAGATNKIYDIYDWHRMSEEWRSHHKPEHSIVLWEVQSGKLLQKLTGHKNTIHSVAFAPSGKMLASGSDDHTVRLWYLE